MDTTGGDIPVIALETVDSTNLEARRWVDRGGTGARMFVAQRQTGGVGQRGRTWHSPEGGLWCTLAWPVEQKHAASVRAGLGLRVGIACWRTVSDAVFHRDVRLKLPNDVLIDGQKVCGCLTETFERDSTAWVIAGVGINVANDPANLPDGMSTTPTAIDQHRESTASLEDLLMSLTSHLREAIESAPQVIAEVKLHGVGRPVDVVEPHGRQRAVLLGLTGQGRLRVRPEISEGAEVLLEPGAIVEYA